jgi:hypothetical protein
MHQFCFLEMVKWPKSNGRNQMAAFTQVCAFSSPFSGVLSEMETFQKLSAFKVCFTMEVPS